MYDNYKSMHLYMCTISCLLGNISCYDLNYALLISAATVQDFDFNSGHIQMALVYLTHGHLKANYKKGKIKKLKIKKKYYTTKY